MEPDDVAVDLLRRIEAGEFPPGVPLPAVADLREQYPDSTEDTMRSSLTILAEQRVVSQVPRLGFVVGDLSARHHVSTTTYGELPGAPLSPDQVAEGFHATESTGTMEFCVMKPGPGGIHRIRFTKSWHGGLEGHSEGVVLTPGNPAETAAGFVALELFEGSLDGREGRFALQHHRSTRSDERRLVCEVVPDSGTDALTGLAGSAEFRLVSDTHHTRLVYRQFGAT